MLVVPVVEGLDWRRPPPITVALIVLNFLVFFLYQSGDAARMQRAADAYIASSLPALELPRYKEHLRAKDAALARRAEAAPPTAVLGLMESDETFMDALRAGAIVAPDHPQRARWEADRARFDALLGQVSYRRFGFTPALASVGTAFSSIFLHGDLSHLLGNMLFLFIVGVAVESALGAVWFLPLYVATGLAGNGLHMLVNPHSMTPMVGASGAIAGVMGVFTIVYGLRRVNFFYWFVVIFGFRTMHGLVMLPIWIAWELLQYGFDRGGRIGYLAHAGGLMSGAALGLLAMGRSGGERVQHFHRERDREAFDRKEYERARALAAKLDFGAASTIFARLAERFPDEADLMKQWHAIAKSDPSSANYHRVVDRILALPRPDAATREFQRQAFLAYLGCARPAPRFEARSLAKAGITFARGGDLPEAERAAELLLRQSPAEPRLPVLWDALAVALAKSADADAQQRARRYRGLLGAQARAKAAPPA